jgi:hypothetical protein
MTAVELIVQTLKGNLDVVKMTLADFTDAELLIRPCPASHHVMWQIGHCIGGECFVMAAVAPGFPVSAPSFSGKFTAETAKLDDPAAFPTKAELLAELERVRLATIAAAGKLTEAVLAGPSPVPWAPNVGGVMMLHALHFNMHLGQIQVARRKLGKKVLF